MYFKQIKKLDSDRFCLDISFLLYYKTNKVKIMNAENVKNEFENGKWLDLSSEYSSDIVDRDFGADWWCWNVDICIDFDFDAHPQILQDLQNVVRKHIPSDQLRYCEDAWADGDTQILISSITWTPRTLRPVKNLLDEINEIIKPILSECDGWSGDFNWCQVNVPFAVADIVWTSDGFAIKGLEL